MADEIERLVTRLQKNEETRVHLLQELAHDLRTPVSSLHSVLETMKYDGSSLDDRTKSELTGVAYHETEYLKRLVEDLLFLALVLEPKYKNESENILIGELIGSQMKAAASSYPKINCRFENIGLQSFVLGSPHLLRRLFRNAFENAFSFARSEVTVGFREAGGRIQIVIRDDGPGLSQEAITNFGKTKALTRYQETRQDGRISIGLGSVIIQTIAEAHSGTVEIRNLENDDGEIRGAELEIAVPLASNAIAS